MKISINTLLTTVTLLQREWGGRMKGNSNFVIIFSSICVCVCVSMCAVSIVRDRQIGRDRDSNLF